MGGGDRHADSRRTKDGGGGADVGGRAGVGVQGRQAQAHRLDDLPAAPQGADGDGGICRKCHPFRDNHALPVFSHRGVAGTEKEGCDHAHGLLRVVGTVTEAERGGRRELETAEGAVHRPAGSRAPRVARWRTTFGARRGDDGPDDDRLR